MFNHSATVAVPFGQIRMQLFGLLFRLNRIFGIGLVIRGLELVTITNTAGKLLKTVHNAATY